MKGEVCMSCNKGKANNISTTSVQLPLQVKGDVPQDLYRYHLCIYIHIYTYICINVLSYIFSLSLSLHVLYLHIMYYMLIVEL